MVTSRVFGQDQFAKGCIMFGWTDSVWQLSRHNLLYWLRNGIVTSRVVGPAHFATGNVNLGWTGSVSNVKHCVGMD